MGYRTIVADPPWRYDRGSGVQGAVEDHYGTMTPAEIAALPVESLAADSAHLYLWVTNLKLAEADGFGLVARWGFRYVTMLTWHKLGSPGLGYYFRGDTEHVLFGVRGKCPIDPALRLSNHFAARRTGHSEKPDRFYEMVEAVSPEPRLEMFARRRRVGWDVWGNEAPPESEARTQLHAGLVDTVLAAQDEETTFPVGEWR
jgi:N6-adenosine-specific RNA methylase IME4